MSEPDALWAYDEPASEHGGNAHITMTRAQAVAWMRQYLGSKYPANVTDDALFEDWRAVHWADRAAETPCPYVVTSGESRFCSLAEGSVRELESLRQQVAEQDAEIKRLIAGRECSHCGHWCVMWGDDEPPELAALRRIADAARALCEHRAKREVDTSSGDLLASYGAESALAKELAERVTEYDRAVKTQPAPIVGQSGAV